MAIVIDIYYASTTSSDKQVFESLLRKKKDVNTHATNDQFIDDIEREKYKKFSFNFLFF